MPFVQGHLRKEQLSISIRSECAHCARPIELEIDSRLNVSVAEKEAEPVIFLPFVNLHKFTDLSDTLRPQIVFFWSEEHAREQRRKVKQVPGLYLTLSQMAQMVPVLFTAVFVFSHRG